MSTITTCAREGCGHPHRLHGQFGCLTGNGDGLFCPCDRYVQPHAELEQGRELREEGMAAAGTTAPGAAVTEWRANATDALGKLIAQGDPFTADDLVALAGMPPRANMVGPVFMAAARQGRIRATGETRTAGNRAASHARAQRVWITADLKAPTLAPDELQALRVARRYLELDRKPSLETLATLVSTVERLS